MPRLSLDARLAHRDSVCGDGDGDGDGEGDGDGSVETTTGRGETPVSGNGYEFSLTFSVAGTLGREAWIEAQLEGGCGDARAYRSGAHLITLRYLREADSAHEALVTAVADVRRVVPLASLVEAGPDFVSLSDIAGVFGVTRQTMRKLLVGGLRPAPLPVHEGRPSLWRLAMVLGWLRDEKHYPVDDQLDEIAWAAMRANTALTARFADPVAQEELAAVLDLPKLAPLNPWRVIPERPRLGAMAVDGSMLGDDSMASERR